MSAANINRVTVTGNLTRDPELKAVRENGPEVCEMRIAVNGRRKDGDSWVDKPNFFDVSAWGGLGKLCRDFLSKGRGVAIDGRLDWREWDGQDEKHHEAVTIVAENIHFLPRSATSQAKEEAKVETEETQPSSEVPADSSGFEQPVPVGAGTSNSSDDDIPF